MFGTLSMIVRVEYNNSKVIDISTEIGLVGFGIVIMSYLVYRLTNRVVENDN